jgi:RNA polymerase sigma-70 factor (ECF subfamily)
VEQTDEQVMQLVQQGEVKELAVLFQRHQRALFRYFYHLSRDQAMSEDLVQDVFVRLLRSAGTYRAGGSFQSWLYQVARSAFIDQARKRKPEAPLVPEEGSSVEPVSLAAGPEQTVRIEQEADLVRAALDRLPADKRELLVMTRYQELTYSEIAEITNAEVATVKVRIHRAVEALRREYRRLSGERPGEVMA